MDQKIEKAKVLVPNEVITMLMEALLVKSLPIAMRAVLLFLPLMKGRD